MAKRNINEVLEFISRWGESEFSLLLLEDAPIELIKKRYEQAKKMGTSPELLKKYENLISSRNQKEQDKKEQDELNKTFSDTEESSLRKPGTLLPGEQAQFEKDWKEAQKKKSIPKEPEKPNSTKPEAKSTPELAPKKPNSTKPEAKSTPELAPKKPNSTKPAAKPSIGSQILSGARKTLGGIQGSFAIGSRILNTSQTLGSMLASPAGQGGANYAGGLQHLASDIEDVKNVITKGKIPRSSLFNFRRIPRSGLYNFDRQQLRNTNK